MALVRETEIDRPTANNTAATSDCRGKSANVEGRPRVVIVGGGFGGLNAALALKRAPVDVTLIDKNNYHLFQPLLYQVATGGLSPADIASPLRNVLKSQINTRVLLGEVKSIDPDNCSLQMDDRTIPYDFLILATGATHHYFGNDQWEPRAPGLKTLNDALTIRRRVFEAFERAELEPDPHRRSEWLTFVVVGGGPTGVELAGALAEIAQHTLKRDFRHIDPTEAKIVMIEGSDRPLPTYPSSLSEKARRSLERVGVEVITGSLVSDVNERGVKIKSEEKTEDVVARTVLWGAGVKASGLARDVVTGRKDLLDRTGRVKVEPDMSVPGRPNIFVLGDLANFPHQDGEPLPGVAPVAMSQGRYVARLLKRRLRGKRGRDYRYRVKGSLATIGRDHAVADFGWVRFSGFPAWIVWLFVHLMYLVEFDNRLLVLTQWAWNYFTRNRGARLIV